jgi:hypothetical protein
MQVTPITFSSTKNTVIFPTYATGGIERTFLSGSVYYRSHVFNSDSTFYVLTSSLPQVTVMVVGGGGGCGQQVVCRDGQISQRGATAGGGAGGMLVTSSLTLFSGSYSATIGQGGVTGSNGTDSYFYTSSGIGGPISLRAIAGGRGGGTGNQLTCSPNLRFLQNGNNGGSGGGGQASNCVPSNIGTAATGTADQGNNGGRGITYGQPGGGGGAGSVGQDGGVKAAYAGGDGGSGSIFRGFDGSVKYFAGGGGGGAVVSVGVTGSGGIGGGGYGGSGGTFNSLMNGVANTGGGGGGASGNLSDGQCLLSPGGAGGSGIVCVTYVINPIVT